MPSSALAPRSTRKRSLALTPSTNNSYGTALEIAAGTPGSWASSSLGTVEEPPTQRARRDVLSTQLETLQAELDHERSLRGLDQKRFAQTQQRLERQVEFAVEEANEIKALMEELRDQSEEYAETLRGKHQALQNQCQQLQYALDVERANHAQDQAEEDPRIEQLEELLEARAQENQGLRETIEELQEEVERLAQARGNASTSTTPDVEAENAVLQSSPAPPEVMKELNSARIQLAESERKNRQLKRHNDDLQKKAMELLQQQERVKSATARTQHLERELQERDHDLGLAQAQLSSWVEFGSSMSQILVAATSGNSSNNNKGLSASTLTNSTKPNLPPEISVVKRYLQEATKEAHEVQAQNQQLETQLERADDKIQDLERTIRELDQSKASWNKQLQDANKRIEVAEEQVRVLEGQEAVWKREVASLRSIVKTFDELPLPGKTSGEASNATVRMVQASLDAANEELKVVKEGQANLQKELDEALNTKTELLTKHNTVLEKFAKLKEAVYAERAKAEKAEARAVHAEELAGKGSFNPETTRVLHLQHNPLTEALKQEVGVLRRQVEALTASNNKSKKAVAALTPGPDVDPNKLHQRLKESFKEQIGRFREGVYLLTGYKIDMIPDGERPKFKVRSMFAEREQDQLMFQWPAVTPVEGLDLLDTELAKLLMTTPSYEYVTRFGSMPAFLASTQLSLFEKQTMI